MSEQRKHPRHLMLESAKIFVDRRSAPIGCSIFDISEGGACILLPPSTDLPGCFELAIANIGALHQCRVVWRQGYEIGVEFLGPEMSTADIMRIGESADAAPLAAGWNSGARQ